MASGLDPGSALDPPAAAAAPVRRVTEVIGELLAPAGRRILEVGCGEGAVLGWLRRRGAEAIGLEVELDRLARARTALGPEGLLAGVGEALPFAQATLDGVLYHNSLHHVPVDRQTEALVEAARVLRPNGRLVVLEPLAEGDYFELVRALEDETAIRAAARAALARCPDLGLVRLRVDRFDQLVQRRSPEELVAGLVAADPARRARVAEVRPVIARLFDQLGTPTSEGRAFRQPMLVACFARPADGLAVAVARLPEEKRAVRALRLEVFVAEQGVPVAEELDAFEEEAEYVLARRAGEPVGCLRWRRLDAAGAVKIERVAVRRAARGRGVATAMLRWCLARLDGKGLGPCVLHAQLPAEGLYARLGFRPEGEPFLEAGIPHRRMVRSPPEPAAP